MALFYKFILDNFQDRMVICYRIDGTTPSLPRALKHRVIIYATIAVFVATHVCWRILLQKHGNSIRTNRANGGAVFEVAGIRYNSAHLM